MRTPERVTIQEYDTTDAAKDAENLLLRRGLTKDIVSRSGKKIRVLAPYATEARALLAGGTSATAAYGGVGPTDPRVRATPVAYGQDEATATTDKVPNAVSSVTDTVQQAASSVVDTAQQAASTVVETVQEVTRPVTSQVGRAAEAAADQVQSLASTVRQGGTSPQAPAVQRQAAQTTARALDTTAQYLRQGDVQGMLEDLRRVIRRNPGRSLLLGLGLGYLARGTLFAGSGAQGARGSQQSQGERELPAPLPPAVPMDGSEVALGAEAVSSTGTLSPPPVRGELGTLSGVSTPAIGRGAGSDLPAPSLYETDAGMTGAIDRGAVATPAGEDGDAAASTSTADSAASDLSESPLSGTDVGMTGDRDVPVGDTRAGEGGGATSSIHAEPTLGSEGVTTDQPSSPTMPTDEQLRQWDARARGTTP